MEVKYIIPDGAIQDEEELVRNIRPQPKFDGKVTVRVNFHNRIEYEKFRKYILKTNWAYACDYPLFEEQVMEFHNTEDLERIDRIIIGLLQIGFDVYCCRYKLDKED